MNKVEYQKAYYLKNREKLLEEMRRYRVENFEKISANKKSYYAKNKQKVKEKYFLDTYSIDLSTREQMSISQNGKCAICNVDEKSLKRNLCIDHCHKSGKVRGLLCDRCNAGLGYFEDNIETFNKIIDYLRKNTHET